MCIRKAALIALSCLLPLSASLACGPDFPMNLLDDRQAGLLDLPDGSFMFEAQHLLPAPDDKLRAAEDSPWDDADEKRAKVEAIDLSADEIEKVKAMRAAANPVAAAAAGVGLAPELLDYTLGAIEFKAGNMAAAVAQFKKVLALDPPSRPRRGLWAQYMIGRAQVAMGNFDIANAAFTTARERARSGVADPFGLGVATFGEQARMRWHRGNIKDALQLYAQQAAHGSRSGSVSLLFVTRSILAHPEMFESVLDDPLAQRLLAAYYYTRTDEFSTNWPRAGSDNDNDVADGPSKTSVDINGFLAAVERHGIDHFDGADRLAAGAYRAGNYQLAQRLAAKSQSALAAWIRAKLAMRAGDHATAANEYALAAKGFPIDETWNVDESSSTVDNPLCRVETERGVFALSRGDYVEAMARMYAGAKEHWPDAAYVAERVLTVDELKDFVDKNVPRPPPKLVVKKVASDSDDEYDPGPVSTPPEQLRALLARRLLREGRDDDAVNYFDDPALHQKVLALLAARKDSTAWKGTDRAAALFKQAKILRADGMELIGTELEPDFAEWGGSFVLDPFQLKPANLVARDEHVRVAASQAAPNQRFHYRYVAATLAEQAAQQVHPRSQAYAAMMCSATKWMLDTDATRASALYHRYLREGAWVPWGGDFGRKCPTPDFADAATLPWRMDYWAVRHFVRVILPYVFGLLVLGGIVFFVRRRRKQVV